MKIDIVSYILPEDLLKYFNVTGIKELGDLNTKKMTFEILLEEKNEIPEMYVSNEYESKGFLSSSRIQGFPIRGKAVYLVIKRRRWRHRETKKEITRDFTVVAEGSRLTQGLSDFLKGTGRDPRRYD